MTTSEPRWIGLLRQEAKRSTIAASAGRIGYSRTTVSLVLSGKYPGDTSQVAKAVIQHLEQAIACPYLGSEVDSNTCRTYANGPAPTHNPMKMAHWRACQQCQNRCKGE